MKALEYYKPIDDFYKDAYAKLSSCYSFTEGQLDTMQLILEEWLTNLIKYSGFTYVNIWLEEIDKGTYKLSFEDDGIPFNPLTVGPKTDYTIPGGLGISIMKSYSKEFGYVYNEKNQRNTMYLIF